MATTQVQVTPTTPAPVDASDAWRSFRGDMDRLFERFASSFGWAPFPILGLRSSFGVSSPAVDIAEDDTSFKLSAELPGMTEKDIQVSLSGTTLTIKGEKRQQKEETKKDYYLSERSYGEFRRSFVLPDGVDGNKIDAKFSNGVLTITLPKTAQAAPKTIEVKAAA